MQYKSYSDLAYDIRSSLHKIPSDIDLVVGVPKSGMIPAMMIGLALNCTTTGLDGFLEGRLFSHGQTRRHPGQKGHISECRKILIVEDCISSGVSLENVKKRIVESSREKNVEQILYMAVYCLSHPEDKVDIYCQKVSPACFFEWNWPHLWLLEHSCVDIDGVLCIDPTEAQDDDGEQYMRFIEEAPPMYLPKRPINILVTNRLEKWRTLTKQWLAKHDVRYDQLVMLDLPTVQERAYSGALDGNHKAKVFSQSDCLLFIESSHHQALGIAKQSGKPVLSIEKQVMVYPETVE